MQIWLPIDYKYHTTAGQAPMTALVKGQLTGLRLQITGIGTHLVPC